MVVRIFAWKIGKDFRKSGNFSTGI